MPSIEHIGNDVWVKECTSCRIEFTVTADKWGEACELMLKHFTTNFGSMDELASRCKSCSSNARHRRKDSLASHRDVMLEQQEGKCFLCTKEINYEDKSGTVDHDHTNGRTRKVLCRRCNLWMATVDSDEWLVRAIIYRDSFRCE